MISELRDGGGDDPADAIAEEGKQANQGHAPKVVHIVDDDFSARDSTAFLLRLSGYDVQTHSSGRAFLDRVPAAAMDAVLLDVSMPWHSGIEVLQALQANGAALRVIMITGDDNPDLRDRAMALGAKEFILKPYSTERLIDAIER